MLHDIDVRTSLECFAVSGFLIPAIAQIPLVLECDDIQLARQINRLVGTAVINQKHLINDVEGKLFVCLAQCPGGVVRRHDYDNFFFVEQCRCLLRSLLAALDGLILSRVAGKDVRQDKRPALGK
jgi:hypothetical protein